METTETTDNEIVFTGDVFQVRSLDGKIMSIESTITKVCVLPYLTDDSGMLDRIGVVKKSTQKTSTLLTGEIKYNDPDILESAIAILYDKCGIKIREEKHWNFLGTLYIRGIMEESYPCFCVKMNNDVTESLRKKQDSGFHFVSLVDAIETEDVLIHSGFLKLFRAFYKKENY